MALMFLNGDGMRGGRAHYTIEGVPLIGARRTAPRYRFTRSATSSRRSTRSPIAASRSTASCTTCPWAR